MVMNASIPISQTFRRLAGRASAAAMVLLCVAVLSGCQPAKVAQPLTDKLAGNEPETQLEFWHTLTTRPVTSNDEAFHGLLLYLDGKDEAKDYAGRVDLLRGRNLLPADFDQPADHAMTRGNLAVAIVGALRIKGGLVMRLTGPSPRYATRELVYMELYPASSPQQTFTGSEFVGLIGRMEDYQRSNASRTSGGPAATPAENDKPGKAPIEVNPADIR